VKTLFEKSEARKRGQQNLKDSWDENQVWGKKKKKGGKGGHKVQNPSKKGTKGPRICRGNKKRKATVEAKQRKGKSFSSHLPVFIIAERKKRCRRGGEELATAKRQDLS